MTTSILNFHVYSIEFTIWPRNEGLLCYTRARYKHQNKLSELHTQI